MTNRRVPKLKSKMAEFVEFVEQGLIVSPGLYRDPRRWHNPKLHAESMARKVNLQRVDSIIRKHHPKCRLIANWIATRDRVRQITHGFKIKVEDDVANLMKEQLRSPIFGAIKMLEDLRKIEATERKKIEKSFGRNALKRLTKRDVKKWPVFTLIIKDLYHELLPSYQTRAYTIYGHDNLRFAHYPQKLLKMIAGLLKEYYPPYFSRISANHVKSRIPKPL